MCCFCWLTDCHFICHMLSFNKAAAPVGLCSHSSTHCCIAKRLVVGLLFYICSLFFFCLNLHNRVRVHAEPPDCDPSIPILSRVNKNKSTLTVLNDNIYVLSSRTQKVSLLLMEPARCIIYVSILTFSAPVLPVLKVQPAAGNCSEGSPLYYK